MPKEEILTRIKEAEGEADKIIKRAQEEREAILREAKREALALEEELRGAAEQAFQTIISALGEETRRQRERILDEGEARAQTIRTQGMLNLDRAVDLLLRRFQEEIHASA